MNPRTSIFILFLSLLLAMTIGGCRHPDSHAVSIKVITHGVPAGDTLHLCGDLDEFGNWVPPGAPLHQSADSVWQNTFSIPGGTQVAFRVTRGGWRTEALDPRGPQYTLGFSFTVPGDTMVTVRCPRWLDIDGGTTPLSLNDLRDNHGFWVTNGWHYHGGDDSLWHRTSFNDSSWEIINSSLYANSQPLSGWGNLGWFRLHLDVDSTLWNRPLAMRFWQIGASEVYLDDSLIYKFGTVGRSAAEEQSSQDRNPLLVMFAPQRRHVLAVRYSDFSFERFPRERFERMNMYAGFQVFLDDLNGAVAGRVSRVRASTLQQGIFTAIPLALAFIHFILFIFYPRFRENLHYALCMFGFAGITFASNQMSFADNVMGLLTWNVLAQLAQLTAVVGGLFLFSTLRHGKVTRFAWWCAAPAPLLAVWACLETSRMLFQVKDLFTVVVLVVILWGTIRSWNKSMHGSSILAWGFLALAMTIAYALLISYDVVKPIAGVSGEVYVYGALALGVAMSVFLSKRFAKTHRDLELRLEEVHNLSERTLEQERQAREGEIERRVLEADNARKTQELEEARRIQLAMLPKNIPEVPGLSIAVAMKTATEVGGDYYDFAQAPDGTLTIAIGDATGHGTKAGTMVVIIKSLFRDLSGLPDLRGIFERYTEAIRGLNLPSLYMALQLVRIKGRTLSASSAGMPEPLVLRAATGRVEEIALKGMPLGRFTGFPYETKIVDLSPGDCVVLMSDGFPEMFNADGQMLGYDRVKDVIKASADLSPAEMIGRLMKAGGDWAGTRPQADDMTFVVIRVQ